MRFGPADTISSSHFQATVNGVSGFTPGASGTIAPGGFIYTLFADEGQNDNLNPGTLSTNPTITGPDTTVMLAVGASITGSAGVQQVLLAHHA